MNSRNARILVAFFALLGAALPLLAQERPPARAVQTVAPQVWALARSSATLARPVSVTGVDVKIDIVQGVATTEFLIRLRNPTPTQQEATLLLCLPHGAAVRSFDFQGKADEPKAEILPAAEAKATYTSIVAKLRDPALLEFVGFSLLRTSVFPVPASGTQAVKVVYEHILPSAGGRLEYVLPRTQRLDDANVPFTIEARIRSARPLSAVYSPTHPIRATRRSEGEVHVALDAKGRREPGAFLLTLLPQAGDVTATLLAHPDPAEGGGTFLLLAGLPAEAKMDGRAPVKREVILVLDRSGSMRGKKIEQAKAALEQVLQGLKPGETFNIITYNGAVEKFSEAPVVKNAETEAAARHYIASIKATGGTNLHDAVLEALRLPAPEKGISLLILLSDGLPTVGVTSEVAIRDAAKAANAHQRRLFTFGVGHDVNAPLLDRLAETSRGSMTCVQPSENVEEKVSVLFDKLAGPLFTSPSLVCLDEKGEKDTRAVSDLLPRTLPDLYRGDRLILLGKYRDGEGLRFRLTGEFLGEPRAFEFRLDLSKASVRNGFVPRLWASRKIALLVDALRQAGAGEAAAAHAAAAHVGGAAHTAKPMDPKTKELVDEIVRLSVKYGILTEYTAFLAREGTDLTASDHNAVKANGNLQRWAVQKRSGAHGMSQQANNAYQRGQSSLNGRNFYNDRNMNGVESATVLQVGDLSFFRRGNRWLDARIASKKKIPEPDEVVEFGTERFTQVLTVLVGTNRQGVLSLGGEALFEIDGKVVSVKFPETAQKKVQTKDGK
ncbi:MAG: VWA domain-containing protein [Planctomycetota bacterium]|jgi:Ca-activated chloride channel family protein